MRGNFGLKLQNSPKLPHVYMWDFIVIQMSRENTNNREKAIPGYPDLCFFLYVSVIVAQLCSLN